MRALREANLRLDNFWKGKFASLERKMERKDNMHREELASQKEHYETLLEHEVNVNLRKQRSLGALQAKCEDYEKEGLVKDKMLYLEHEKLKAARRARDYEKTMKKRSEERAAKRIVKLLAAVETKTAKVDFALDQLEAAKDKESEYGGVLDLKSHVKVITRTTERGRPYSKAFESQTRKILSSGMSAEACRLSMRLHAAFFLGGEVAAELETPEVEWHQRQREGVGLESWAYTMLEIAAADKILQHGFDETKIDGVSTMNQWVWIKNGSGPDAKYKVVTVEAGGVLVDGEAEGVKAHVKKVWDRGHAAVLRIRKRLDDMEAGLADELAPLAKGGVKYLKAGATMHDACHTANRSARLLAKLKKESGEEHYGEAVWAEMSEEETKMLDHLCANHSRNLPIAAFNRLFDDHLTSNHREDFEACMKAGGGRARLERDGEQFLRSICKLACQGRGCYAKGDGVQIADWLDTNYPDLKNDTGRAELSKRQDWVLEVSAKILPMLQPLYKHLVEETLVLGPNVLRDSSGVHPPPPPLHFCCSLTTSLHIYIYIHMCVCVCMGDPPPPPPSPASRDATVRSVRPCVRHHVGHRF
jgi:hypothetical protein